jgi:hypothetical protein
MSHQLESAPTKKQGGAKKALKIILVTTGVVFTYAMGAAAGSGGSTKTETVTVPGPTVTVTETASALPVAPSVCLRALDLADEGFGVLSRSLKALAQNDPDTANEIMKTMPTDRYLELKASCRALAK